MGDFAADLAHRLDQFFGRLGKVQCNELDSWVFDQRLERRAGCDDDIAPFIFGSFCKVLDDRRAGDTVASGDEGYFRSHGVWLGLLKEE